MGSILVALFIYIYICIIHYIYLSYLEKMRLWISADFTEKIILKLIFFFSREIFLFSREREILQTRGIPSPASKHDEMKR
jgi:hypothetical protein